MNHYTQLLYYIKSLAQADPLVNTVTRGMDFDLNKRNIYPLVHIEITDGSFTNGSTVVLDVQVTAVAQRDINKREVLGVDKFWQQDNEVDNLSEMLAVLNRIYSVMYRDFCNQQISVLENPALESIVYDDKNLLDGWRMTISVEMPNNTINLCDELPC